ncbi:MAG: alpha/beta hydrolase [Roseobacter sp.]
MTSPLLFDPRAVEAAKKLAIMIPGALARVDMFEAAQSWTDAGYALAHYRFPGLDGRPLSPKLRIEEAAQTVADFVAGYPAKKICLLGYSTGGPIAIRAAEKTATPVRVAAMSSAVPMAGGLTSLQAIAADILAAAARARSVRRNTVWREYFKVLLLGRAVVRDKALMAQAQLLLDAHLPQMVYPDAPLLSAHADDLRRWKLPKGARLSAKHLAFFAGAADPVFSVSKTEGFARLFGEPQVRFYPGQGHLLFMTHPSVFDDILTFFEAAGP